ncbi:hypothetical protein Sjap_024636 [Stephania japonica]|uniref:Secreted peptide n=1 Tax=Stephania japonica TaxID=461633 RepID=A0AAP0EDY7_9MAGN
MLLFFLFFLGRISVAAVPACSTVGFAAFMAVPSLTTLGLCFLLLLLLAFCCANSIWLLSSFGGSG